jgi:hypothetical protein
MGAPHRWKRLPVRVFFDASSAGYAEERKRIVLAGFDQWTKATNSVIRYVLVGSEARADVVVRFEPVAFLSTNPRTLGETYLSLHNGWVVRARMTLAVGDVRPDELTYVAAHEWGHALGINGHSDDPDDLMYAATFRYVYPDGRPAPPARSRGPSERDINTLKICYPSLFAAQQQR